MNRTALIAFVALLVLPGAADFGDLPQRAVLDVLALAWFTYHLAAHSTWSTPAPELATALTVLLGWSVLTVSWSVGLHDGLRQLVHASAALALYLVVSETRVDLRPAFVAVGTVVALLGVAQWLGLDWPQRGRMLGATMGNPNMAAQIVVLALPCAFVARWWGAVAIISMLGYLGVAGSLSAWFAVIAMAAVVLVPKPRETGQRVAILALLAMFAGVLLVGKVAPLEIPVDSSTGQRIALWANTAAMIADHPLGVGLGGWANVYPAYARSVVPDFGYALTSAPAHAHNDYLGLVAELGVVGLVLAGVVAWHVARACWRRGITPETACLVALAVLALFSFPLERAWPPMMGAAALGTVVRRRGRGP